MIKSNVKQILAATSMALLASWAEAAIQKDGIWTGKDWYDEEKHIGVANGVPYSKDPVTKRRIASPMTYDGDVSNMYQNAPNVQRVKKFFTQK